MSGPPDRLQVEGRGTCYILRTQAVYDLTLKYGDNLAENDWEINMILKILPNKIKYLK